MIERFNGRLPGYVGHGKMPFCHVDDVTAGHVAAMSRGQPGERYLLTGENATLEQIFDLAAAITGTRRPRFHIPLWFLSAYGWISVFFAHITGRLPLISYPVWSSPHPFFFAGCFSYLGIDLILISDWNGFVFADGDHNETPVGVLL